MELDERPGIGSQGEIGVPGIERPVDGETLVEQRVVVQGDEDRFVELSDGVDEAVVVIGVVGIQAPALQ